MTKHNNSPNSKLLASAYEYKNKNRHQEAFDIIEKILAADPINIRALLLKAEILLYNKKAKEAEELLCDALHKNPTFTQLLPLLHYIATPNDKYIDMLSSADNILSVEPSNARAILLRAIALYCMRKTQDAINVLEAAQEYIIDPSIYRTLGEIYINICNAIKAEYYYNKAYDCNIRDVFTIYRLLYVGTTLINYDDIDRLTKYNKIAHNLANSDADVSSVYAHIQKIALKSVDHELYNKLGDKKKLLMHFANTIDNKSFVFQQSRVITMSDRIDLLEAHRTWGEKIESIAPPINKARRTRQNINNKTRLGFISGDFTSSHVGFFIWPLLCNLDKEKFELYCYALVPSPSDLLQKMFKDISTSFKECDLNTFPKESAETIHEDCLDVLIGIGMWYIRPQIIAHKPAPIQISWLDYPHSEGFPTTIDYLVTDPYIRPESPNLTIEKQMMMPHTWIVMHKYGFPPIEITDSLPEDTNGYITFGVTHCTHRLTEENFRVWATIMKATPKSRLIYIRPEAKDLIVRHNICKHMLKNGISSDRISFIAKTTGFLEDYNKLDIILDAFPHVGATTTSYGLWMGVPIVTLVGPAFFERLSYSLMSNCGLSELCAFNLHEYHNIAMSLVQNKEFRKHIRSTLRATIMNSPLWDEERFAYDFSKNILQALGK